MDGVDDSTNVLQDSDNGVTTGMKIERLGSGLSSSVRRTLVLLEMSDPPVTLMTPP